MKYLLSLLLLFSCTKQITQSLHGRLRDGTRIDKFELNNKNGIKVQLSEYGASIIKVVTADHKNRSSHIIYGHNSFTDWISSTEYSGATIGRYADRISKGKFVIDNQNYQLTTNEAPNHIHGGKVGFNKKKWSGIIKDDKVLFTYLSPDNEEGYPGNLSVSVTYQLSNDNTLSIVYQAVTDKRTIVNLTNHAYWRLSSTPQYHLTINSDQFIENGQGLIPTGRIQSVSNTTNNFQSSKKIEGHFDQTWKLSENRIKLAADLYDKNSGRGIKILTDQPGIHLYNLKNAIALEAQNFADAPNNKNFPSAILHPDQLYKKTIIYKFYTN